MNAATPTPMIIQVVDEMDFTNFLILSNMISPCKNIYSEPLRVFSGQKIFRAYRVFGYGGGQKIFIISRFLRIFEKI